MVAISPTQSDALAAIRAFILAVLPSGVAVITGQMNRTPEPVQTTFVVVTPIRMTRLETNIDSNADCAFVGSFAGNVMIVDSVSIGTVQIGATVIGEGVAANTVIQAQTSGPAGGPGNYTVSVAQTLANETLATGAQTVQQNSELVVQMDFHSTGLDYSAGDNAMIVSTLLRDEFGVDFFAALEPPQNSVTPFYADDPKQIPFQNDQNQIEWRWVLEGKFQINQTTSIPQQYFGSATVDVVSVDVAFPPS